ncbi:hypothetical protein DFA_00833 [Cavenderia fasciculata]|uniref:Uncharacterized protein n=1 Tax=Cavenderia fasciculata TaxID=261658 RepID=F4PU38_CACFS|nr:uncharacterized protein DFA_00833 [Cavenderia fasciculata]EGG20964.1 hypothetical protein DFA_00833 [Cavenderia fasciculata]|eukprot:XP_004358814.1 hypothetical protein DFA_00833 [Cavenderia fasciculata]
MNRKYLNSCSSYLILLIFIFLIINDDDGGSSCGGTCCHGSVVVEKDDYNIEEANTLLVPMEGAGSAQSFLHPGVSKTETNILGSAPSSDIRYSFPVTPGMTKQDYKCTYLRFDMNIGIDPGQFSILSCWCSTITWCGGSADQWRRQESVHVWSVCVRTVVSAKGNGTSHLLAKDNSVRGTINMTAIILPLINKISSQGMACLDTLAGLPGKPDYAYLVECSDRRTQHYVMSSMDNSIRTTSNLCVSICNITRVTRGGPCCMNRCESNVDPASTPLTQQWKLLPLNYTHTRLQSAMNASLCLTAVSPLTPRNPYDRAEPPILTLQLCQQTNDPEFLSYSSHHQIWAIPFNLDRLAQQRKLEEETKTKKMEVLNN